MDPESIFEKSFVLKSSSRDGDDWSLPKIESLPPENSVSDDSFLKDLKAALLDVKCSLNGYDIAQWHKHTSECNPSGFVNTCIRSKFHPELCTQAWCKFHEILCFERVVPEFAISAKSVVAVHLCEAPGAFICSLNHYLKSHFTKVRYKWLGCTLNPYYEGNDPNSCIADDRLIFRTLDRWCFGPENTGDISTPSMLDDICKKSASMGTVCLVTADGSINCQNDPARQELDTTCLKYSELLYALKILCPGGSLIMKIFTPLEYTSIQLLYIICCMFDYVSIRKPATSKPGNSELYVIAKGYASQDASRSITDALHQKIPFMNPRELGLFPVASLPSSFMNKFKDCIEYFVKCQIRAIKENQIMYEQKDSKRLDEMKKKVAAMAVEKMALRKLPRNQRIIESGVLTGRVTTNVKLRPHMLECNSLLSAKTNGNSSLDWKTLEIPPSSINLLFGKRLSTVKTSLFCDTGVLMSVHESWQLPLCTAFGTGEEPDLSKVLSEILGSGQIYELDIGPTWKPFSEIYEKSVHCHLLRSSSERILLRDDVLLVSLIKNNYESTSIRELHSSEQFMKVILYVLKNFESGANLIIFVTSVLTRLMAGLLWIVVSTFQSYVLSPNYNTETPGLIVVCRDFKDWSRSLTPSIEAASCSATECDEDTDLLEIVPLEFLLKNEDFVKTLKMCNHSFVKLRRLRRHCFIL